MIGAAVNRDIWNSMAAIRLWVVVTGLLVLVAAQASVEGNQRINVDVLKALALEHKEEITAAVQATVKKGVEDFFAKIRASIREDVPVDEPQNPSSRILGPSYLETFIKAASISFDPYVIWNDTVNFQYRPCDQSALLNATAANIEAIGISSVRPTVTPSFSGSLFSRTYTFDIDIKWNNLNVISNHQEIFTFLFLEGEGKGSLRMRVNNVNIPGKFVIKSNTFLKNECEFSIDASDVQVEIEDLLGSSSLSPVASIGLTEYVNEELLEPVLTTLKPVVTEQVCDILKDIPEEQWRTLILGVTSIDIPKA